MKIDPPSRTPEDFEKDRLIARLRSMQMPSAREPRRAIRKVKIASKPLLASSSELWTDDRYQEFGASLARSIVIGLQLNARFRTSSIAAFSPGELEQLCLMALDTRIMGDEIYKWMKAKSEAAPSKSAAYRFIHFVRQEARFLVDLKGGCEGLSNAV